jgi:tetratricopeptide (TPR) repeat protein
MFRNGIILIIASFSLSACAQKSNRHKIDPTAVKLNNMAIDLSLYISNTDSAIKAIKFLDSATAIDSNYFLGYYNMLMFLNQLRQYDKAIVAIDNLVRLRPNASDIYMTGGIVYEKIGDTVSSRYYFQKSLKICTRVLDTMNVKNRDYNMLALNKAISLIMLGQTSKGNLLLSQVYENQTDSSQKELTRSFMNKNKVEIVEMATNPSTVSSASSAVEAR